MFQNISADRLETLLDQGGDFTLADVREPEEYRAGHLAGAVNLPVQQIIKMTEQSGFSKNPEKFLGIPGSGGDRLLFPRRPGDAGGQDPFGIRIPGGQCLRRTFLLPGPPSDRRPIKRSAVMLLPSVRLPSRWAESI